jgi:hypothetical protein
MASVNREVRKNLLRETGPKRGKNTGEQTGRIENHESQVKPFETSIEGI